MGKLDLNALLYSFGFAVSVLVVIGILFNRQITCYFISALPNGKALKEKYFFGYLPLKFLREPKHFITDYTVYKGSDCKIIFKKKHIGYYKDKSHADYILVIYYRNGSHKWYYFRVEGPYVKFVKKRETEEQKKF